MTKFKKGDVIVDSDDDFLVVTSVDETCYTVLRLGNGVDAKSPFCVVDDLYKKVDIGTLNGGKVTPDSIKDKILTLKNTIETISKITGTRPKENPIYHAIIVMAEEFSSLTPNKQ